MESVDDETLEAAMGFIEKQVKADKPFFVWWNATRMHFRTHVKPELQGQSNLSNYADGMIEHDNHVGILLDKLDELKVADNTIVLYTTDNGPHKNTWPDAASSPFRNEKTLTGKVHTVFQLWFVGLDISNRVKCLTTSFTTWTGSLRLSLLLVMKM